MKRISSLPVAEYCAMADKIGADVASVNAARSTCFHAYCETGRWPESVNNLPEQDFAEIQRWKKPTVLVHKDGDNLVRLEYKDSIKETRVSLDKDFNFVETRDGILPGEIENEYPNVMCSGTADMAWHIPSLNLVVVEDIKSSVFAVKSREKSLQLHAYGIAFAKKLGAKYYKVGIWDATDGKHYMGTVIDVDSWECEEYKERIRTACNNVGDKFTTGTHCGGCWKREICPSHIVKLPDDSQFAKVFGPNPTVEDIRQALVEVNKAKTILKKVTDIAEGWADRHGGIPSEDGSKIFKARLRSGRTSLDKGAIMSELGLNSLDKFEKQGNDYAAYDWYNAK
jgi:CRISPR/Cas system-associated exonuclease Cas4 (RecB family)